MLLGTGTPNPDPDRSGPSVAIIANDAAYLVDFGAGVVRRAAAAARNGLTALDAKNLRIAFVTHLHSDHTLGYADVILTPWVLERREPLEVYGPSGLKSMTKHILEAYSADIRVRLDGLQPANRTGYRVNVHEVVPGVVYADANVKVTAIQVTHRSWRQAFGYRFDTPDRSIVISGDTSPTNSVIDACHGCDVLIHEVYSEAGFSKREPEWQRYHAAVHTSSRQLAEIARKARPGLLILYHQLIWSSTEQALLDEVRSGYDGKIVSGHDLDVY